jgi:hypothetical protein
MADASVTVTGLQPLIRELRGSLFKDVNKELRSASRTIAEQMVPHVQSAVRASDAPQADVMAGTVRAHSDRVPVVVVGKVNPKFSTKWRRKGQTAKDSKLRRGSLAHGIVYGPKGGRRSTPEAENYYRIPRANDGGAFRKALDSDVLDKATEAYLKAYAEVLRRHGFIGASVRAMFWNGRG